MHIAQRRKRSSRSRKLQKRKSAKRSLLQLELPALKSLRPELMQILIKTSWQIFGCVPNDNFPVLFAGKQKPALLITEKISFIELRCQIIPASPSHTQYIMQIWRRARRDDITSLERERPPHSSLRLTTLSPTLHYATTRSRRRASSPNPAAYLVHLPFQRTLYLFFFQLYWLHKMIWKNGCRIFVYVHQSNKFLS
jgi:hypothetical protein